MRRIIARIFRILFKFSFFSKRFYGLHQKLFLPLNLFKGVVETIQFKQSIFFELHIDDWIQENIYFLGKYEESELNFLALNLKNGDVILDIGANIGVHSLYAASLVGEEGKVISFEPFTLNFNRFKKNISLNNFHNLKSVNLAISDFDGELEIFYNLEEQNLGMVSSFELNQSVSEKVKCISVDSFLKNEDNMKIDIVKIDIEGAEYAALKGMKKMLEKDHPKILLEILLESNSENREKIFELLQGLGYKNYLLGDHGELIPYENFTKKINHVFI